MPEKASPEPQTDMKSDTNPMITLKQQDKANDGLGFVLANNPSFANHKSFRNNIMASEIDYVVPSK